MTTSDCEIIQTKQDISITIDNKSDKTDRIENQSFNSVIEKLIEDNRKYETENIREEKIYQISIKELKNKAFSSDCRELDIIYSEYHPFKNLKRTNSNCCNYLNIFSKYIGKHIGKYIYCNIPKSSYIIVEYNSEYHISHEISDQTLFLTLHIWYTNSPSCITLAASIQTIEIPFDVINIVVKIDYYLR